MQQKMENGNILNIKKNMANVINMVSMYFTHNFVLGFVMPIYLYQLWCKNHCNQKCHAVQQFRVSLFRKFQAMAIACVQAIQSL